MKGEENIRYGCIQCMTVLSSNLDTRDIQATEKSGHAVIGEILSLKR